MKLWPSRTKHKAELVSDLDAILVAEVSFKLHDKVHVIKPLTTEAFFEFSNAYAHLWEMHKTNKFTNDELIEAYIKIFTSVCSTIKADDVKKMALSQVAGLFQLIIETVTGKTHANEKKTLQQMMGAASLTKTKSMDQGLSPKLA